MLLLLLLERNLSCLPEASKVLEKLKFLVVLQHPYIKSLSLLQMKVTKTKKTKKVLISKSTAWPEAR